MRTPAEQTNPYMTTTDIALAMMVALMWGLNNIGAKVAIGYSGPLLAAGLRFTLAAIILLPWMRLRADNWKATLLIAAISGPVHFMLLYTGFAMSHHVGAMTVVILLWIPSTTLLAIVILREWPSRGQVAGLVLAFGGVVLMGFDPALLAEQRAVLMCAAAGLCWGIGVVITRRAGNVEGLVVQAWMALLTGPLLLLASRLFEMRGHPIAIAQLPWLFWGLTLFSVIGGSILGNAVMFTLVKRNPVAKVTPILLLTPVVSFIAGIIVLGEAVGLRAIIGSLAALTGALVVTLSGRRRVG